jgi:hypothetical protein
VTGLTSVRYWGDIELLDQDELAEDSAGLLPIDAIPMETRMPADED